MKENHLEVSYAYDKSSALTGIDQPPVYIVLLNWNGWQDTLECIRSLRHMEYWNWHVVVVDNGSTDDSVKRLKEACPEVSILETHKNLGFAAGNNVGIRFALRSGAAYVFVLNNDTTVFSDTVSELVRFAEKQPRAAMMGPKIDCPSPQRDWPVRRRLDLLTQICTFSPLRRIIAGIPVIRRIFFCTSSEPAVAQFLSGSALFFRAATLETIGLFDENTFLDFEELIMAEKVRSAGFSVHFVPKASIWHKGSASASGLRAKRYIENAKSEEYFLSHYVRPSSFERSIVRLIRFLTYGARALRYRNYREHFSEFMNALQSRQ
jgi:GT2 family glycosyltransferase